MSALSDQDWLQPEQLLSIWHPNVSLNKCKCVGLSLCSALQSYTECGPATWVWPPLYWLEKTPEPTRVILPHPPSTAGTMAPARCTVGHQEVEGPSYIKREEDKKGLPHILNVSRDIGFIQSQCPGVKTHVHIMTLSNKLIKGMWEQVTAAYQYGRKWWQSQGQGLEYLWTNGCFLWLPFTERLLAGRHLAEHLAFFS